ncbi:MAG: hypothetical protein C4549_00495 [Deltaproteobacteria bacterium]|jgi:hypothetical protein|nr:MAG: hypothetical protein C4549_00495 [Deltaproteobacteria bacterium]
MQVAEIELYEILKPKIGEKEARTLVEYIETKVDRKLEEKKDVLATKQDIAYLKQDIANLEIKLEKTRADIIKWMFLFWIGQLASLIAILELFFKR